MSQATFDLSFYLTFDRTGTHAFPYDRKLQCARLLSRHETHTLLRASAQHDDKATLIELNL